MIFAGGGKKKGFEVWGRKSRSEKSLARGALRSVIRLGGRGAFRLRSDGFDPGPSQKAPDEPFFESPTHNSSSFSLCSYSSVRKRPELEPGRFQPDPITTFSAPLWCFSRPHFHQHLPCFLSTYSESFHVLWRGRVRTHPDKQQNTLKIQCQESRKECQNFGIA